jgi:AraC family transcriptional regulator
LEVGWPHALLKGVRFVEVQIVTFPETKVTAIEHWGQPSLEHDTVRKPVAWKLEQKLFDPAKYRGYGVHYTDPRTTPASEHHVEFCLSIDREVGPNSLGNRGEDHSHQPPRARS